MSRFVDVIEKKRDVARPSWWRVLVDVGNEDRVQFKFNHNPTRAEIKDALDAMDKAQARQERIATRRQNRVKAAMQTIETQESSDPPEPE